MDLTQIIQQNIYYIIFGLLVLLMFKGRILSKVYNLQTISVQDAFQDFKNKTMKSLFLDVRTQWELERESKIKKSKLIPLAELKLRLEELKKYDGEGKKIILVCRSGSRARTAGIKLKKAGFSNVFVLHGGMIRWENAAYPVIRPKQKQSFG